MPKSKSRWKMASVAEIMQLCRLCLVKEQVNVSIFDDKGDIRQIFLKITACLPIKVSKEDKLPKKICDGCLYKLELLYQFWNTTSNAEKQLLSWLSAAGLDANTKTTEDAMAVVTQSQVTPKEEPNTDPSDEHCSDSQHYTEPEEFSYHEDSSSEAQMNASSPNTDGDTEPAAKRPRKAKTKRVIDLECDVDSQVEEAIAKTEDESDDDMDVPTFVNLSERGSGEAGPSGIGISDAPCSASETAELFSTYKSKYGLKRCVVLLGDLNQLDEAKYTLVKKRAKPITLEITRANIISSPRFKYRCEHCMKRFKDYGSLEFHRIEHKAEEESSSPISSDDNYSASSSSQEASSASEEEEDVNENSAAKFECQYCKQLFKYPHTYSNHLKLHQTHFCGSCKLKFATKEELENHVKEAHKIFSCSSCPQVFYSENNLQNHLLNKHPKQKGEWACEICKLDFESFDKLVEHNQTQHSFNCGVCKKEFSTFGLLTAHRYSNQHLKRKDGKTSCVSDPSTLHQNVSEEVNQNNFNNAVINCDLCRKSFQNMEVLQKHLSTHFSIVKVVSNTTPTATSNVNKQKTLESEVQIFPPLNKEISEFKCTLCNEMFNSEDNLQSHLKKHMFVHSAKEPDLHQTKEVPVILDNSSHINVSQSFQIPSKTTLTLPKIVSVVTGQSVSGTGTTGTITSTSNLITPPPLLVNQNQPRLLLLDDKRYFIISQGGTPVQDGGVIKFVTSDNHTPVMNQQNPVIQTIPNLQPINNFLQPAINQTIVLPNSQNASQISITNQTYNTGMPQNITQGTTNFIYTTPLMTSNVTTENLKVVNKTYGATEKKVTTNLGNVTGKILDIKSHLLNTNTLNDEGKMQITNSSEQTDKRAPESCSSKDLNLDTDLNTKDNFKPKIFLKPLSQLLEKPTADSETRLAEKPMIETEIQLPEKPATEPEEKLEPVPSSSNQPETVSKATSDLKVVLKLGGKKIFKCHMCNVTCKKASRLNQHQNKYKCKICGYGCCKLKALDIHYAEKHNFKNRCVSCDTQFPTPVELQLHKKFLHLCIKCNRCYFDLQKHKENYKCINCEFSACNASNLDAHYKLVHKIMTRCAPCNVIFYSTERFQQHKQDVHFCDKCSTFKMDLNIHKTFCKGNKREDDIISDPEPSEIIELDSD